MCDLKPLNADDITDGRATFDEAAISATKNYKNSTNPLAKGEHQSEAMSKIPGMEEMRDRIAPDVPVELIKAEMLKNGNIKTRFGHGLAGGKEMIAQLVRRPEIYAIGNMYNGARRRAELYLREQVKPLDKSLNRLLSSDEGVKLMAIMKEEDVAGKRLTEAQLDTLLSDKQKESYTLLRKELDVALARQNEALKAAGQEPITAREAYFASKWGGDWKTEVHVLIRDSQGNIVKNKDGSNATKKVWHVAEKSKGKAEHALAYIKEHNPDVVSEMSRVEHKADPFVNEGAGAMAGYREMISILGKDDPAVMRLKEMMEQKVAEEGHRTLGQHKHFDPKTGVRGFAGDRPWVNDTQNAKDHFNAQLTYIKNAHMWAEMQSAVAKTAELLNDPELVQSQPDSLNMIRNIARAELGYATPKAIRAIDSGISKFLGNALDLFPPLRGLSTDNSSINHGLGAAKTYFYITKLGVFNVPFAVMSVVQPVFTVPHHLRLTEQGFDHNPLQTLMDSMTMTASTILPRLASNMAGGNMKDAPHVPQLFRDAYKYLDANGVFGMNQMSDVGGVMAKEKTQKVLDILSWSITAPESIARTTAFMGYVSHLNQSGKFKGNDMALFAKADELTKLSMGNYGHTERAGVFNTLGTTGNALATLQTFKINQLNQLYDFGKGAAKGEGVLPFVAMLGTQLTMAGAMGIYGLQQAEWMWDYIRSGLVKMGVTDKEVLSFSPKKVALETLPAWASMGGLSQVMGGTDYHSRTDAGVILDPSVKGMLPMFDDLWKQASSAGELLWNRSQESADKAAMAFTPSSLKGFVETQLPTMTGRNGKDLYTVDNKKEPIYHRSDADKTARGIPLHGVPTVKESATKQLDYRNKQAEGHISDAITHQSDKYLEGLRNKDPIASRDALREVAKLGGPWETLVKNATKSLEDRTTTAGEKATLRALANKASISTMQKDQRARAGRKNLESY